MKRIIIYSVLIILFTYLGFTGKTYIKKGYPSFDILNNDYYFYNIDDDSYDKINIKKDILSYEGTLLDNRCSTYNYEELTSTMFLNCGKEIKVSLQKKEVLGLNINNKLYFFFKDKEKSYEREIEIYLNMTLSEYHQNGINNVEKIKISAEEYQKLIAEENVKYFYTYGQQCTKSCDILNNNLEKLNKEVKYIDKEIFQDNNEIITKITESDKPIIIIANQDNLKIKESNVNNYKVINQIIIEEE